MKKLSPTQERLIAYLKENEGKAIVRGKGGFWFAEGKWPTDTDKVPTVEYFGTRTVDALATMGILKNVGLDKWKWGVYRLA